MSQRKLQAIGYRKTFVDYEDDTEWRLFVCEMEESHLRLRNEDWIASVLDETDKEKWMPILNAYLAECGVRSSASRRVAANYLLNAAVEKLYDAKDPLRVMTSAQYKTAEAEKKLQSQNNQNPLNNLDYTTPQFASRVGDLCRYLGIVDHPDPVTSLKAACIFITKNLNEKTISERNEEAKSAFKPKTFELNSFPLGMVEPKDAAVSDATRILRLLNLETLRGTQTTVNETLVAIQNLTIDMDKRPDWGQVQYGKK